MRPRKDFYKLMIKWNEKHGTQFSDVNDWLVYLESKHSVRNMARLIPVDRTVLTERLKEI